MMRTTQRVHHASSPRAYFEQRDCWDDNLSIDEPRARMLDFYVSSQVRSRGLGFHLVTKLIKYFDSRQITQIGLSGLRDNPAFRMFGEYQGFKIGHQELSVFRDPKTGTAHKGALTTDFTQNELAYA